MKKFSQAQVFWGVVVASALVAAILSLVIGLQQSVWFDEAYSILLAKQSFGEIVRLTSQDVHPPLYYWTFKVWIMACGDSELALRSLSALFLGLSVGTIGLLLRRMFGASIAMRALPFVVFAPFFLRYGYEIRMYSMVSFIGVAATFVLVEALWQVSTKKRRWLLALYAALVALGVYTLYFSALIWITHLVWVAWRWYRTRETSVTIEVLAAYVLSVLFFLPWLPVFLSKAGGGTLSSVTHHLDGANLIGIVSFSFFYESPWHLGLMGVLVGLLVASIIFVAITGFKQVKPKEKPFWLLLAAYTLVPVAVLTVVTYFAPIYLERYIAHFIIGGYAFVGVSVALSLRRAGRFVLLPIGVIVLSYAIGMLNLVEYGNYNFQRPGKGKPVVALVASRISCNEGETVFADDPFIAIEIGYYLKGCQIRFASSSYDMSGGYAPLSESPLWTVNPQEDLKGADTIYYVYYDNPKLAMPEQLRLVETYMPGGMAVAVYN